MKKYLLLFLIAAISPTLLIYLSSAFSSPLAPAPLSPAPAPEQTKETAEPFFINSLKSRTYPVSEIVIEETLASGSNFKKYIASYQSDGLKIYGLLTIPDTQKPQSGFPAVIFVHGYLDPEVYSTTARYVAYQNGFASQGFVTFKPDLRGHGRSQGEPVQSSFSEGYVVDVLNLLSALKNYKSVVDPERIGMWGHSMGGGITLRSMVISQDIKAGVIWAGVVGDYSDLVERYRKRIPWIENSTSSASPAASQIFQLISLHGLPSDNPQYWNKIDPYHYLADISGPIQLNHGTDDLDVPYEFSVHLKDALLQAGKTVEYYEFQGADHNIASPHFSKAMDNSVRFFKIYL